MIAQCRKRPREPMLPGKTMTAQPVCTKTETITPRSRDGTTLPVAVEPAAQALQIYHTLSETSSRTGAAW